MKNDDLLPVVSDCLPSHKVEVSFPLKGEAEYTHVKAKVDVHGNRECEAKQVKVPTDMVFVILGAVIILAVLLIAVIHINITIHASNISEPAREAMITLSDMDPVDQGNSIDITYDARYVYAKGDVYVRDNPDLQGGILATLASGTTVQYLGEFCVDSRGVAWYKIQWLDGNDNWVSSVWTELR